MNKVSKSQPLLDKAYARRTNEIVSKNIRKAENEVAAMGMIAEFLVQKKYEKAKDHLDEVEELELEVSAPWDRYTTNIHPRAAAANAPALPVARRPPPAADSNAVKLVTEFKPDTLSHDASAGELRIWCLKYEADTIPHPFLGNKNIISQKYMLSIISSQAIIF